MGVESGDGDDGFNEKTRLSPEEIKALNRDVAEAFAQANLLEQGAIYDLNGALVPATRPKAPSA